MKRRSKIITMMLVLIALSVIGGAVILLRSGRPDGGDLSAYMEREYGKEFEVLEEFTYIAYTDGEPDTQRELKCPAVRLQDKENSEIRCFAYAYPMEGGDWIYRDNYSRKVFLYCLGEENLAINNGETCGIDTSFSYPCLLLDNTDETAQKLQNAVRLFHELYPYEGYESFAVEGSMFLYQIQAGNISDLRQKEAGTFGYDTPIEKYKVFLEELETYYVGSLSYKIEEDEEGYKVSVYDGKETLLYESSYPREPVINRIGKDTLEIHEGAGNTWWSVFVNGETGAVSEPVADALACNEQTIVYPVFEGGAFKIIVRDIYDEDVYKEITDDFPPVAIGTGFIKEVKLLDGYIAILDYYTGNSGNMDEWEEKRIVVNLD